MPKNIFKISVIIIFFIFPFASNAARLYFDPAEVAMGPGDSMELKVKIDVTDACINTVDAKVAYPADYIFVREFTTGDSILSIWINQPSSQDIDAMNRKNQIEFTGGIPGGYCGRIPGDPGESNIIGRIVFTVPSMIVADEQKDEAEISFAKGTTVLLNDGLGTAADLDLGSVRIRLERSRQGQDFDWSADLEADTIPPEPFVIELVKNPAMFNGAYHINFSTVDKQTGIDHYEILEIRPEEEVGVVPKRKWWERFFRAEPKAPGWVVGKMPYVLTDQSMLSIVKVRALDKAGNERLVEYIPPRGVQTEEKKKFNILPIALAAAILLALPAAIWFIVRLIKKIKHNPQVQREENNYEEEKQDCSPVDSDRDPGA